MKYSPFLSCREAARLITAQLDRDLTAVERATLAVHLKICDGCPIVVRQFGLMRRSVRALRDTVE